MNNPDIRTGEKKQHTEYRRCNKGLPERIGTRKTLKGKTFNPVLGISAWQIRCKGNYQDFHKGQEIIRLSSFIRDPQ